MAILNLASKCLEQEEDREAQQHPVVRRAEELGFPRTLLVIYRPRESWEAPCHTGELHRGILARNVRAARTKTQPTRETEPGRYEVYALRYRTDGKVGRWAIKDTMTGERVNGYQSHLKHAATRQAMLLNQGRIPV